MEKGDIKTALIIGIPVGIIIELFFVWLFTKPGECIAAIICYGIPILYAILILAVVKGFFQVLEDIFRK